MVPIISYYLLYFSINVNQKWLKEEPHIQRSYKHHMAFILVWWKDNWDEMAVGCLSPHSLTANPLVRWLQITIFLTQISNSIIRCLYYFISSDNGVCIIATNHLCSTLHISIVIFLRFSSLVWKIFCVCVYFIGRRFIELCPDMNNCKELGEELSDK